MFKSYLTDWGGDFHIDALGLVTMMGAEEVDKALGRLVHSPFTEFLPLLGGFVMAENRFSQPIPGNVLYNITDGIKATDVSGWLSRWLMHQDIDFNTASYEWSQTEHDYHDRRSWLQAVCIGIIANGGLLALAVLAEDRYGMANTAALITSVSVRHQMLEQHKLALDKVANEIKGAMDEYVKIFCLLANGKAVSISAPRGLLINGFLTTPRPVHERWYKACQYLGWFAFTAHVICIGLSSLVVQLPTVLIMILATVACARGWGCQEMHIGRRIHVEEENIHDPEDNRTKTYVRFRLSREEEASMLAWALFPQRSNVNWWERYLQLKAHGAWAESPSIGTMALREVARKGSTVGKTRRRSF